MGHRTAGPCAICRRTVPPAGLVCDPCRQPLPGILDDIVTLYAQLELEPAAGVGSKVSGSREAPLPLSVDVLDATLPPRYGTVHDDGDGDPRNICQTGHKPVATILGSWVRDWRQLRDRGERLPDETVPILAAWLKVRLDWACAEHPAVDDWAAEMRTLRALLRRLSRDTDPQPERLWTPCRCNLLTLVRVAGEDYPVRCRACGTLMTEDEYQRWAKLQAAYATRGPTG